MIRQSFKRYGCESGIASLKWNVTCNYAYSPLNYQKLSKFKDQKVGFLINVKQNYLEEKEKSLQWLGHVDLTVLSMFQKTVTVDHSLFY